MNRESPAPVVAAQGLYKTYNGKAVVNRIDFGVSKGECFGLLGPNGAGKTTTLRMLLGTTLPDGGELTVLGHSVPRDILAMRQKVGVVPQRDNLDPDFTVIENLHTYASYFGLRRAEIEQRVNKLLAFAALEEKSQSPISALSGGMQRRLTLARALINDPVLIVLDEPTTGLDPQARHVIWQRLRSLMNEGKTVILTTHYMEEAQRLCDRVAIMDHGEILDVDAPARLVARYIEPHVFEVFGGDHDRWLKDAAHAVARTEQVGETLFCYCREEQPVFEALRRHQETQFLHRPANLEDVFLKLTGRDLRD